MNTDARTTISVTRDFAATPERIFDAFLDPKQAARFLFATPGGKMIRADIDARPGGKFIFTDRRDGEYIEHTGEFLEIVRPRRLAFTFAVPKFSAEKTRVTIDVKPKGSGTEVTLTHDGVLPDYAERTQSGWTEILDQLAVIVGAEGQPFIAASPEAR